MEYIYGEERRVSWGNYQDYMGIDLDYWVPGDAVVTMINYLKRVISYYKWEIKGI